MSALSTPHIPVARTPVSGCVDPTDGVPVDAVQTPGADQLVAHRIGRTQRTGGAA